MSYVDAALTRARQARLPSPWTGRGIGNEWTVAEPIEGDLIARFDDDSGSNAVPSRSIVMVKMRRGIGNEWTAAEPIEETRSRDSMMTLINCSPRSLCARRRLLSSARFASPSADLNAVSSRSIVNMNMLEASAS